MYRGSRLSLWVPGILLSIGCGGDEAPESFGTGGTSSSSSTSTSTSSQTTTGVHSTTTSQGSSSHQSSTSGGTSTAGSSSAHSTSSTSTGGTSSSSGTHDSTSTQTTSTATSSSASSSTGTSSHSNSSTTTENSTSSNGTSTNPTSTASSGTTSTGNTSTSADETTGLVELDCEAAMPTSGAQAHNGNGTGGEGNLAWEIWSNTGTGALTTYDVPAFTASWDEDGGYLGRLGYEWGGFNDTPVPYESLGTITAQFVANKSGSGGDVYSYVGMYGWSSDPCVEWYVIEDSFKNMPVNPGTTTLKSDNTHIDDSDYFVYTRPTSGNGGTRCSGVTDWIQYYSIRKTARSCGTISLTEHFDAWKGLQMPLGDLLEAKILVEVGGGTGRVDFPVANVVLTP